MNECNYCRNPVKPHWNFCRRCGARLEHEPEPEAIDPIKEEIAIETEDSPTGVIYEPLKKEEKEEEPEKKEEDLTDDELVARISFTVVSREEYNEFIENSDCGLYLYRTNRNRVLSNNFIGNGINAFFEHVLFSIPIWGRTIWRGNYWNDHLSGDGSPYIIRGQGAIFVFRPPWFNIDWHPAQEPYEIGGAG